MTAIGHPVKIGVAWLNLLGIGLPQELGDDCADNGVVTSLAKTLGEGMMDQSLSNNVAVERLADAAIVRFSSPPEGYIANKGAARLIAAVQELLADDSVRGIVLTGGQPGVFIRHADVGQITRAAQAIQGGSISASDFNSSPFPSLGRLIDQSPKPIIAAIEGVCMGGGLEIAMACCMRIATPTVTAIGLPEIRIGIFPANGTQRLSRLIGRHKARLFMLNGTVVDASEALRIGLIDEMAASAVDRAVELIGSYGRRSAGAVAAILELTREPVEMLEEEQEVFANLLRDDKSISVRTQRFTDENERLDQLD